MFSSFPSLLAASPLDTITTFFTKGGWFMIPLALCSLAAVTIVLLRFFALRRENVLPRVVESGIDRFQPGGNTEQLAHLVGDDPATLSSLTRVTLSHLELSRAENTEAVQTAARREIMRLEGGLAGLELIVGIAPLLGLLGAISGLVNVFSNLGKGGNTGQDTAGVALGIAEALNTTIFGLAIAIPTLIFYTYFAKRVEAMAVEMESLMADLIAKCYRRPGAAAATRHEEGHGTEAISAPATYVPQTRRIAQAPVTQPITEPESGIEPA